MIGSPSIAARYNLKANSKECWLSDSPEFIRLLFAGCSPPLKKGVRGISFSMHVLSICYKPIPLPPLPAGLPAGEVRQAQCPGTGNPKPCIKISQNQFYQSDQCPINPEHETRNTKHRTQNPSEICSCLAFHGVNTKHHSP
jgi:hypothetical protein